MVQTLSSGDLQNLQATVLPKYLPLTGSQEVTTTVQSTEKTPKQSTQTREDSASYWKWESIPEPTICILSTDNIVSNLIAHAQSCEGETGASYLAENDDYWEEEVEVTKRQQCVPVVETSYWDWPAEQAIDDLLALEDLMHQDRVSGASGLHSSATVSSDDYWAW